MTYQYDIIVIGAGPGGYQTAIDAASLGKKVLVIEKNELGGVCLNVGCIPTKALLKSAKRYSDVLHASTYGIEIPNNQIKVNWEQVQARKNDLIKKLTSGIGFMFKNAKVTLEKGEAVVEDAHTVSVNGKQFTTEFIIAATGSIPRMLPLPGFDEGMKNGFVITSTEALSLPQIPKHLIIIGGGVIGIEFAFMYLEFGAKVTILQGLDRILELLDNDISTVITAELKRHGAEIIVNAKVLSAANNCVQFEVNGEKKSISADHVLVSVGRKINTKGLEKLNLKTNERNVIEVDNQHRTSVPNVFVVGDACGKAMLAHAAYMQGAIALDAIFNKVSKLSYNRIPACIFTHPEIGTIGYSENELLVQKIPYFKHKIPMSAIGKSLVDNITVGFAKLLVGQKYGEILGCQIVGGSATDIIAEIAVAMESELVVEDLARSIHPHPTISEVVQELAKHIYFKHFYKQTV